MGVFTWLCLGACGVWFSLFRCFVYWCYDGAGGGWFGGYFGASGVTVGWHVAVVCFSEVWCLGFVR